MSPAAVSTATWKWGEKYAGCTLGETATAHVAASPAEAVRMTSRGRSGSASRFFGVRGMRFAST